MMVTMKMDSVHSYVADNPAGWANDMENPARRSTRGKVIA